MLVSGKKNGKEKNKGGGDLTTNMSIFFIPCFDGTTQDMIEIIFVSASLYAHKAFFHHKDACNLPNIYALFLDSLHDTVYVLMAILEKGEAEAFRCFFFWCGLENPKLFLKEETY